tara:strand:+ start:2049 stop:2747 length:699 start_codon:yes stop_codon:yes gene_type:complete
MPRKPQQKVYFGQEQEYAVRMFLTATTWTEKDRIYKNYLYAPLNKMIDSIIRRYKLYRKGLEFRDIHSDTLSFLITKAEKFKPEKGKKAYSYFGTICKNYLMGQIIKDRKEMIRNISYEDISSSIQERDDMVYYMHKDGLEPNELTKKLIVQIEEFMTETDLNENEEKIGLALVDVFSNYEAIFVHGKGNKFNKNLILLSLREMTGLTTKEIRNALKKYKVIYKTLVDTLRK